MKAYLEIEMPKDGCTNCPLARRGSIFSRICVITEEYVDGNYERGGFPTECPLQELPPHGRLGDLDVLEQMFSDIDNAPYSEFDGGEPFYSAEDAAQIIRLAPTIIPAEQAEEGILCITRNS